MNPPDDDVLVMVMDVVGAMLPGYAIVMLVSPVDDNNKVCNTKVASNGDRVSTANALNRVAQEFTARMATS